ncbi:MAG: bifunctional DNA-formamidopyrimidine glycosylase/DNA-(apurinic or apyrimidinic site) lyase [Gammaproteobacteria bacterium]|nr:bifunctional DNA-formamidopyrimidine glycosylase/DNA-(apurinic or apyrimidinic site) lyase [Gammaproteobacteria bacterium]
MPELPEVETTRKGVEPSVLHQPIREIVIRCPSLRWPVPQQLTEILPGTRFDSIDRRAKYLLFKNNKGCLIIHLGMSGSLRIVAAGTPPAKHDHVDIILTNDRVLRFTDPRRFGCLLWHTGPIEQHPLLCRLGPEPLTDSFDGRTLKDASKGKKVAVKNFIMDGTTVVGVGNIYANEALFSAGIRPTRAANRVSLDRYVKLAEQIKKVLQNAIDAGGTTLRDFTGSDGKPGYFKQSLKVYGRGGDPCVTCGLELSEIRLGQRSTVYCRHCQT